MKQRKLVTVWKMFITMIYISSFTFGGGFVIVTFMKKKFVDEYKWIDETQMLDMTALAQSSPGAIAVNAAILVGWKVAGFFGMVAGVLGTIIPPVVIITVISFCYEAFATNLYIKLLLEGMQAGVAAVIISVVFELGSKVFKEKSLLSYIVMSFTFVMVLVFHINVIYIIGAAVILGILREAFSNKNSGGKEK